MVTKTPASMFYRNTLTEVTSIININEPGAVACEEKNLISGKPTPFSHLLWMCETIQNLDTTCIECATRAGRMVGWILANFEFYGYFTNFQSREYMRVDITEKLHIPH